MPLTPHSDAWYDRLAVLQKGYYYPWRSTLPAWHGEDTFRCLLAEHLSPQLDVLEIACAQGTLALEMAARVHSVTAYDRVAEYINLARASARERGIGNVLFLRHDSSADLHDGFPHIPAPDASFDLLVCSKGPFHWILDARRVARPGAVLLMLIPNNYPAPPWYGQLPPALRWQVSDNPGWPRNSIEMRLAAARLSLHSWWSLDVAEYLPSPRELYALCTFGAAPDEVPVYDEAAACLEGIFAQYAGPQGLEVRHQRYIWKAVVPGN